MSSAGHFKQGTEARTALLPRNRSNSSKNEMQKQQTLQRPDRPTSTYDADYLDKFRKFSEAVFDKDGRNIDSIEIDLNRNPSISSRNGAGKSTAKAAQKVAKSSKLQKLHRASLSGDEEEVNKLLNKGVDVNVHDEFGKTPLHNAINGKHLNIVEILLKGGADVRSVDERGDTPLHDAIRSGSEQIVKVILADKKCNVNAKGFEDYTALHIAAQEDYVGMCKILISLGAEITAKGEDQMTPLSLAVAKGASEVVGYLLGTMCQSDRDNLDSLFYNVDPYGSTLLHLAANSGILSIVTLCLQSGANVRHTKESDSSTALHLACALGSIEMVQQFATYDKEICKMNMQDTNGMTPLHHAAAFGNTPVVVFLLEQGASVNKGDVQHRTPLFLSSTSGFTDTVLALMEKGADPSVKDVELRSPLHAAVGHPITMEALCKGTQSKDLAVAKDVTGYAPIHYAARAGDVKSVSVLLSRNKLAGSGASDSQDTPLHIAAKYGKLEVVQKLLKKRDVRIINSQNNQGRTALHSAAGEGHEEITELLLVEGATIERDHSERTPLHLAALRGSKACLESILQFHQDCLNIVDKNQNTALNLASLSGHAEIVKYLLSIHEQEILLNKFNQSVLEVAINADKHEVAMAVAEHDRWKEVILVSPGGGVPQIQTLVKRMPDVAEKVLDRCVTYEGDPNSKDYKITYDLGLVQGKYSSDQKFKETLAALRTMAERRRENCLTHPVCFFLMQIKWKKFGWMTFFFNLSIYIAFLLCFTSLVVIMRSNEERFCGLNPTNTKVCTSSIIMKGKRNSTLAKNSISKWDEVRVKALHGLVIVLAVFHLSKEIMQVVRLKLRYFMEFTNYLEWTIYLCAITYVLPPWEMCKIESENIIQAAAFSQFLGWLNLILYFRRMSFYGKYVIMLTTMFKTLLQVMLLFGLFLMAFGTTFFILIDNRLAYSTLWYSIMKTFAMTLGELNYEDTFIPSSKLHYPGPMNLLFLLFCLGMPIILMNMLIGLAVGDIDKIQQKSVMDRYVMQVELLLEVEESLPSFFLRRVQVLEHVVYPNQKLPLKTRILDKIQGFGQPENEADDEGNELPPAVAQIVDRMEEQENKINEMYDMIREQHKILKAIGRRDGVDTEGGGTLRKGIVSWFKRH